MSSFICDKQTNDVTSTVIMTSCRVWYLDECSNILKRQAYETNFYVEMELPTYALWRDEYFGR